MSDWNMESLIREIPKAEQHAHVDSIWPELLMKLAERNRVALPFDDLEGAERAYRTSRGLVGRFRLECFIW